MPPYYEGVGTLFGGLYKKILELEVGKAILLFVNIFGFSAFISAFFLSWLNVDVFTRTVLSFVGLVFMVVKVIGLILSLSHKYQMWKLDRRERQLQIMEREETMIRNAKISIIS